MPVQPIRPSQVAKKKNETLPDAVIQAFNEMIVKYCNNGHASFQQKEVLSLILLKWNTENPKSKITAQEVFNNKWLDVEDIYRKAGWTVEYDSPAYCESYEPSYKFTKK